MPHDGIRNVADAVAAQPGPIGQIHVLVRREEVLVEPAQLLEHGFGHQAGRAADAKHFHWLRRLGRRHSVQAFERAPGTEKAVAGAVDDLRIVHVDDARRRQREPARLIEAGEQRPQPAGIRHGVVVQKRDHGPARVGDSRVVAAGKATILWQRDDAHGWVAAADMRHRAVG